MKGIIIFCFQICISGSDIEGFSFLIVSMAFTCGECLPPFVILTLSSPSGSISDSQTLQEVLLIFLPFLDPYYCFMISSTAFIASS